MNDKEKEMSGKVRLARSNGKIIEMKVSELFSNCSDYLKPYVNILQDNIEKLNKIPLNSNIDTQDKDFQGIYFNS